MAKLKMLKLPKKPKLGKKPAANASLQSKQAWLRRAHDKRLKYEAKLRAVEAENKKRKAINEASEKASTVISGIGDITEVRPSAFTAKNVRAKRSPDGSRKSGVKKSAKKKAAPKKAAKKKAASRKRR